jgi:uncharacterized protein YecE (DUF72 family)
MGNLFIGTSGYNYPDWVGGFYPQDLSKKEWLSFYCRHFNTLEINATFYHSFKRSVFENWYKQTPQKFSFSIKGSRFITHIKRINNVKNELGRFTEGAYGLKEKLKVYLWQFPSSFQLTQQNKIRLSSFLSILPKNTRHAFEFRHASWFNDDIYQLLDKNKVGFVTNDTKAFSVAEKITGDFAYIRFHGPQSLYSSLYSDEQLKVWAEKIRRYLKTYDVYCYFNNDVSGFAIKNALLLQKLLKFI